jgi:hypothetical protein
MQFCDRSNSKCHQICVNLGRSATVTLAMIRQVFGEETISCIRVFEQMLGSGQTKKGEKGQVHSQEHAHHFI